MITYYQWGMNETVGVRFELTEGISLQTGSSRSQSTALPPHLYLPTVVNRRTFSQSRLKQFYKSPHDSYHDYKRNKFSNLAGTEGFEPSELLIVVRLVSNEFVSASSRKYPIFQDTILAMCKRRVFLVHFIIHYECFAVSVFINFKMIITPTSD